MTSIMLLLSLCAALLVVSSAWIQNGECEGENCNDGIDNQQSSCVTSLLPWLCMIGHICCNKKVPGLNLHRRNAKRKCLSTPRRCQEHGGSCLRAEGNQCMTTDIPELCNGASCTCCVGDNPTCTALPICRFSGGYCYRAKSIKRKILCPSKKNLRQGCSGKKCSCCLPDTKCPCGMAATSNRITGGQAVRPKNKYPWMVGIQVSAKLNGSYICGGSIINNLYIITAAHCLLDFDTKKHKPQDFLVGLADHRQFSTEDDIEGVTALVGVRKVVVHEGYGSGPNNDIGLLQLKKPLDLVSHNQIKPVCLPTKTSKTYEGATGVIYGWGTKTSYNGLNNVLQETTVPILPPNCDNKIIGQTRITPQMLCAGYKKGGKDTCLGDSGGPMTVEENGRHVIVGITSFGDGCGLEESPGVYSRVTAFLDWIVENTQDASYCN